MFRPARGGLLLLLLLLMLLLMLMLLLLLLLHLPHLAEILIAQAVLLFLPCIT